MFKFKINVITLSILIKSYFNIYLLKKKVCVFNGTLYYIYLQYRFF